MLYDKLFANLNLPVKPAMAATGAKVELIQEADEETGESFFGGYAEGGLLGDMGFEHVADAAAEGEEAKA